MRKSILAAVAALSMASAANAEQTNYVKSVAVIFFAEYYCGAHVEPDVMKYAVDAAAEQQGLSADQVSRMAMQLATDLRDTATANGSKARLCKSAIESLEGFAT